MFRSLRSSTQVEYGVPTMNQKTDPKKLAVIRKIVATTIVVHPKDSEEGKKQRKAFLDRWKVAHDSL